MKRWLLYQFQLWCFVLFTAVAWDMMDSRQWFEAIGYACLSLGCWLRLDAMFRNRKMEIE